MLGPPAAFLLLHGIEANFLSPMIMGHRLRLRPVFVFLAVMVWGWLWGIAGAFLAVPLLLALRAFCKRTRSLRWSASISKATSGLTVALRPPASRRVTPGRSRSGRFAAESYFGTGIAIARILRWTPPPARCGSPTSPRPIRRSSTAFR
jgi:hypothetical protein